MPDWIGRGSTRAARRAPLYDYLRTRRPGDVILEGSSLRLANNRSVVVSDARTGFIDYSTGETGNPVDFLVRYLGYGFQDAVAELCEYMSLPTDIQAGTINVGDLTGYAPPPQPLRRQSGPLRPRLLRRSPSPRRPRSRAPTGGCSRT